MMFKNISNCSVSEYMAASFGGNKDVLMVDGQADYTQEEKESALWSINVGFAELSGEREDGTTDLLRQYYTLQARNVAIAAFIDVCRQSVIHFGKPLAPAMEQLRKTGYRMTDFASKEEMLNKLAKFEKKEKIHHIRLQDLRMRIERGTGTENRDEKTDMVQSRRNFLTLLNSLGTHGFRIEKEKTTMEELALMVKAYKEYLINHQKNKK